MWNSIWLAMISGHCRNSMQKFGVPDIVDKDIPWNILNVAVKQKLNVYIFVAQDVIMSSRKLIH